MGDFNWGIWFKKFGLGLGTTLLATGLVFTADYLQAAQLPAEYAFTTGIIILVLNQVGNYIKHTYLTE